MILAGIFGGIIAGRECLILRTGFGKHPFWETVDLYASSPLNNWKAQVLASVTLRHA